MDRIDLFGQALFVPIFLVSVGMLLQPRVMVQPETLKLAGLFILAAIGGKGIAVAMARRPLHLTGNEALLMLGLTIPQAAATLAATVIGFNIGLFDQTVVNAVLVLILVSIVLATLTVDRVKGNVPVPDIKDRGIGKHVLVALEDPHQAKVGFAIGSSIAGPDSGIVRGLLSCPPEAKRVLESELAQLRTAGYANGVDVDPALLVHRSFAEGIVNAAAEHEPTFVLVGQPRAPRFPTLNSPAETVAESVSDPVALFIGTVEKITGVVLADVVAMGDAPLSDAARIASEVAARLGGRNVTVLHEVPRVAFADLAPGQVGVATLESSESLGVEDPPAGAGIVIVLQG
jgi:hypothetical protein